MFWLISLPYQNSGSDATWRAVEKLTGSDGNIHNYRFELPMSLRVGSLDKLMVLSDDLTRVDIHVEGVVNKIRRQVSELAPGEPLNVETQPVTSFLRGFSWDEAKYPLRKPLDEIVEQLSGAVSVIDDELKGMFASYQSRKQQYQAANRKTGGSLAVKDLSTIVPKEAVVSTENLTTAIVTVPRHALSDFNASYESWCDLIVPRSALNIAEDDEYALVRIVVFRRVVDQVRAAARNYQCQVREYNPDLSEAAEQENPEELTERLRSELNQYKSDFGIWCKSSFGEVFSAWIHICAVRLFVESVLRYGLPPKFVGVLIDLAEGAKQSKQDSLRKGLAEVVGKAVGTEEAKFWSEGSSTGNRTEQDMYPYVSFTLDVYG